MNVLILTPDAVGSTLLQRLITIYMQFHEFDRPVINLHELTNGLEKYYSPEFNREILSKRKVETWGYHQSLKEVIDLLHSVDHYKTSRLAHYHIRNRQDTLDAQIPFYKYLDSNFFVIACRRKNIFEHALSMTINKITKKLNVYTAHEKIDTFWNLYDEKISLDQNSLVQSLEAYRIYLDWSENHFNIARYFVYEDHLPEIEQFILGLPIFVNQKNRITWKQNFGIDFNDWNRCHYLPSDVGSLFIENQNRISAYKNFDDTKLDLLETYQKHAMPQWPAIECEQDLLQLPSHMLESVRAWARSSLLSPGAPEIQQYLVNHRPAYEKCLQAIDAMQKLDIIVSGPPIKKQTLAQKQHMVSNFDQCIDTYNTWANKNSKIATTIDEHVIDSQVKQEQTFWQRTAIAAIEQSPAELPRLQ